MKHQPLSFSCHCCRSRQSCSGSSSRTWISRCLFLSFFVTTKAVLLAKPATGAGPSSSSSSSSGAAIKPPLLSEQILRERRSERRTSEEPIGGGGGDDDEIFKVIVGYRNEQGYESVRTYATTVRRGIGLQPLNATAATVTLEQMQMLESDINVEYVERDYVVSPLGEITPYGLGLVNAESDVLMPLSMPPSEKAPCNDPNSFKVGIVDSGTCMDADTSCGYGYCSHCTWDPIFSTLFAECCAYGSSNTYFSSFNASAGTDASHPDIPCLPLDDPSTNCIGKSYTQSRDEEWFRPSSSHGTHVHGTIGALGNGFGVRGVLHDYGVCYIVTRVFGRGGSFEDTSVLFDAIQWTVDRGAKVINMSLGGVGYSLAGERAYRRWRNQDVLFVVAAGNDGKEGFPTTMYPAAYPGVLSVAAVDFTGEKADFSSFNEGVDIAAPGAAILSTVPRGLGSIATVFLDNDGGGGEQLDGGVIGSILRESPQPPDEGVAGELVECPNLGKEKCPGTGGHICLIERGEVLFQVKAENCEASNGAGVIVYNNLPGNFAGTLTPGNSVKIPVAGVSQEEGEKLLQQLGKKVDLQSQDGYSFSDGTSMACPHVAGGAALIWRSCRQCRNTEIAHCLLKTALDKGDRGKDIEYGYGLMQIDEAYLCLTDSIGCCDRDAEGTVPLDRGGDGSGPTTSLPDKVDGLTVAGEDPAPPLDDNGAAPTSSPNDEGSGGQELVTPLSIDGEEVAPDTGNTRGGEIVSGGSSGSSSITINDEASPLSDRGAVVTPPLSTTSDSTSSASISTIMPPLAASALTLGLCFFTSLMLVSAI